MQKNLDTASSPLPTLRARASVAGLVLAMVGCAEASDPNLGNDAAGARIDSGSSPQVDAGTITVDVGQPPDAWFEIPDAWYPQVMQPDVALPDVYISYPDAFIEVPDANIQIPDVYVPPGVDAGPLPDAYQEYPDVYVPRPDVYVAIPDVYVSIPDAYYSVPDVYIPDVYIPPPPDAYYPPPSWDGGPPPLPPMSQIRFQACTCAGGVPGTQVIIGSNPPSACGCYGPDGNPVMLDVPTPVRRQCPNQGGTGRNGTCAPYPDPETAVSARSCCTAQGTCGSSSNFLFGNVCVDRIDPGPDGRIVVPPIVNRVVNGSPQCPDAQVVFLDVVGCCRPNGTCGLAINQVSNFEDIGCLSRQEMTRLVDDGDGGPFNSPNGGERYYLALVFLLTQFVEPENNPMPPGWWTGSHPNAGREITCTP